MTTIAPGWYKDPADPTTQRYWDGEGWLGDPLPADATPPDGPPEPPLPSLPPEPPIEPTVILPPSWSSQGPGPGVGPGRGAGPGRGTAPGQPGAVQPGAGGPGQPWGGQPWGGPQQRSGQQPPTGQQLPPGVVLLPPGTHRRMAGYQGPPPRPHGLLVAGPGARLGARVIDLIVVSVLASIANAWLAVKFWAVFRPYYEQFWDWWNAGHDTNTMPSVPSSASNLLFTMFVVLTAVWFAYEVPATGNSGQTLGKRLAGIKVVGLESVERLGFARSLQRWWVLGIPTLLWLCPFCMFLGPILQLLDIIPILTNRPLRMALHDRIGATVVVHVPRPGWPATMPTTGPGSGPVIPPRDPRNPQDGGE